MVPQLKTRRVLVTPKAGFVIKTTTTQSGFYTASSSPPPSQNIRHTVPSGFKIFVNVAYSPDIPPPPTVALPAEEENEIIKRAIDGDIECTYFVPVVVSQGRPDQDKAGKPCLVFDTFLNITLKSQMTKDVNFRTFVLEIVLSHVESPPLDAQSRSLSLSRTLVVPKIRFKGPLDQRLLDVPDLGELQSPDRPQPAVTPSKPLIEEIVPTVSENENLKSILKKPSTSTHDPHAKTEADAKLDTPDWKWQDSKTLIIEVPKLFKDHHAQCMLLASEDILTLRTPSYFLQITFDNEVNVGIVQAKWRTGERKIVVSI